MTTLHRDALEAAELFQTAQSADELWSFLHHSLEPFGITGILYGHQAFPSASHIAPTWMSSLPPAYLEAKLKYDLVSCDTFIIAGLTETTPVLWDALDRVGTLTEDARKSLELDWDFKLTTGVTLPQSFHNGLGGAAMGCHCPDLSWSAFRKLWEHQGDVITQITDMFGVTLRQSHLTNFYPLTEAEKDVLLRLAQGWLPKEIAHHLHLPLRKVYALNESSQSKLGATNSKQAVATALIFGLISP